MTKSTILLINLLLVLNLSAQKQVDNQLNSWWTYSGNHEIADKFSVHTLYSWRRNDFVKHWQQSLLRLGINYHIDKRFIFTGGYDYVVTFPYGKQPIAKETTEQRIFEQLILKNKIGRVYFLHRYKLEQRFIGLGNAQKFRNRIRYRLVFTIPLNNKELTDKTFFTYGYDELFIGFGNGVSRNFNQNWVSLGFGYKLNKNIAVKLGYKNQYLPKSDGIRVENNHTFEVVIGYSFKRKE